MRNHSREKPWSFTTTLQSYFCNCLGRCDTRFLPPAPHRLHLLVQAPLGSNVPSQPTFLSCSILQQDHPAAACVANNQATNQHALYFLVCSVTWSFLLLPHTRTCRSLDEPSFFFRVCVFGKWVFCVVS
eukprot:g56679.t1